MDPTGSALEVTEDRNNDFEVIDVSETTKDALDAPLEDQDGDSSLPEWVYIAAGCGALFCCLLGSVIRCKCRRKQLRDTAEEDEFRRTQNVQKRSDIDFWSNPVQFGLILIFSF